VGAEVVLERLVGEEEGSLLGTELGLSAGGAAGEAAGVVVVVLGELARLPPEEPSGGDPRSDG